MSKEYLLVLPIDPMPVGVTYPSGIALPLHATVMPWFLLGRATAEGLSRGIERVAVDTEFDAVELVSERPERFGPHNDVPVHVLEPNEPLMNLHWRTFQFLSAIGSLPADRQWTGFGYCPHVTNTRNGSFPPGARFRPKNIALVERDSARSKQVIARYMLGGPPP